MKRLTQIRGGRPCIVLQQNTTDTWMLTKGQWKGRPAQFLYGEHAKFLSDVQDILGDEYALDRLRELVEADREGRCVVLTGQSKKNETIRDLVKIIEWISNSVKKHDFSPFRIVVGALENTFPVVREYQRVIDKHEEEIYLAFKDEEVENALKGEQDG